jgi:hypothetical protein
MYSFLLSLHSFCRWLVLASLLYAIYRGFRGAATGAVFTKSDNILRHVTATIAHIQLTFGVWLYFISPIVDYFLHNFKDAVHERDIRFFGMEHSLMMLIAVVLITIGSAMSKRKETDKEKFKTMAVWYLIGLVVILSSIPFPFSPFGAKRPYFRSF